MLTDGKPIVYWDACVPLSYINETTDRLPHIEGIMTEVAQKQEFHLATSVISIVEVAWAKMEQDGKILDLDTEARIAKLWQVGSPIELVEYFEEIGEKAKRLMRIGMTKGWRLKPLDAIHLATADHMKVSRFDTYDGALTKYEEITETHFPIVEPNASQPVLALTAPLPVVATPTEAPVEAAVEELASYPVRSIRKIQFPEDESETSE